MKLKAALILGIVLGFACACLVRPSTADASRNASGTYSLPAGNPVVTGTAITSTWANTTLTDIKTEITNSLDRGGRGCMTAPMQATNGTVAAPSITFCTDSDTGLYRIGANNPGMAAGGVKVQDWSATGSTMPLGLAVTNSQASGTGVAGTGGSSDGVGGSFTGGSSNGDGVHANGTGVGYGVVAYGGATGGNGCSCSGSLVSGSGVGGVFTGGAPNGNAVNATGSGTGTGVFGQGGSTNGSGVVGWSGGTGVGVSGVGVASNSAGVSGQGNGSGKGGSFTGGATGTGVAGTAGGSGVYGVDATGVSGGLGLHVASSSTTVDVEKIDGYINLHGGGTPTGTTAFTDEISKVSIIKAHAYMITTAGATVTINNSFSVASATCGSNVVTVTLATAMASSTNYTVIVSGGHGTSTTLTSNITGASTFTVVAVNSSGTVDLCAGGVRFSFIVLGAQ